jgi:glycosyltransferase involved in cell wall biosynthesis
MLEREVTLKKPERVLIRHIPCGVPVPRTVAQPPADTLRLLYAGRLSEKQKRISELTRAFGRAVREIPGTKATIIGDGPARASVEQILRENNLEPDVQVKGPLDSAQVVENILDGHVVVLLSDFEGLPVAIMEAMACGLVPVCLPVRSGIPELVDHGVTGLLVNDRSDDFVSAIRRLRTEAGLWERLSCAARERIVTGYSSEVCADRWAEIIVAVQQTSRGRRSLRIPRRFNLPPVDPGVAREDHRMPASPLHRRIMQHSRRISGVLVRRLF